jgi:tetratricopeptide (TPR) repeat protein
MVSRGAESLRLRELRPYDGTRLLREFDAVDRRIEDRREHESAERLVDLCGGLPSALRMAAGLLESQEDLSISRLVDAVVARQRTVPGLSGVEAVVDIALSGLGDEERRLLDLLDAHPGRFFPPELGHLALGERAPEVMDRLCEASVLRPVANSGRGIVELVRTRIHEGASVGSDQRTIDAAAILRFFTVSHYRADRASLGERHRLADSLDTAELTVAPADYRAPFENRREAADWQDSHLVHTPELMRLAADLDRPMAALLLADSCWPACYGRRRLAIGTSLYAYALRIARFVGHRAAETRCAVYLARLYTELGDWEQAGTLVEEAARSAEAGGELDQAVVLEARGVLAGRSPSAGADDAHALLLRSRDIHRRLRRPRGDAMQTYQLGDHARRTGDLATAEAELRDAEGIADRRLGELRTAGGGQSAWWMADDWELLRARVRLALARVLLETDRAGEAQTKADEAWQVFTQVAEPVKEVQAARFLADVAARQGDAERTRDLLRHVERLAGHYHLDQVVSETRRALSRSQDQGPSDR